MRRLQAGKGAHQFRLTVAGNARHPDDLPLGHVEADILEALAGVRRNRKTYITRRSLQLGRKCRAQRAADDQTQKVGVADFTDQGAAPEASVAQHGDAIGDLAEFGQAMSDVNHRRAGLHDAADAAEQHAGGILVERRRRLVEDQHLGLYRQRLGNFQQVFLGHRQGIGAHAERHAQADGVEHVAGHSCRGLAVEQRGRQCDAQIFEHREIVKDGGVLK